MKKKPHTRKKFELKEWIHTKIIAHTEFNSWPLVFVQRKKSGDLFDSYATKFILHHK